MADGQLNRLLEFAELQMAAEAFLARPNDSVLNRPAQEQIESRLEVGNDHASKFTSVQARQFASNYEVLAQYRNDPLKPNGAGFSGTLFRDRSTGELTLSFRSTEFLDDATRDTKATNEMEIAQLGWAFGQIAEMEQWYAQLRADPNLLGGKNFNVTGYSLGGHLATAFNILRREEYAAAPEFNPVVVTYTFNGAGTGRILNDRRLTDLIADFNRIRANYAESAEWQALSPGAQQNLLTAAQARVDAIAAERSRVAGLSGVAGQLFGATGPSGDPILLGYQIASLLVSRDTVGSFSSNPPSILGPELIGSSLKFAAASQMFLNMTEVAGMETEGSATSFVSNSGIHYGSRQAVAIEAQPRYRGNFPLQLINGFFKPLVNNPGENDFGDTHSLALLVDSLSLMAVMEKLDPEFTLELGMEIFAAASKARASQSLGSQGTAEGDNLERVLDALYKLVYGTAPESRLNYESVLVGNTWHLNDHRAPFHERLAVLNTAIDEAAANPGAPTYSFVSLANYTAEEIASFARKDDATGKAYRYALRELNPFVLIADDNFYAPHNIGGELELGGNLAAGLSDEWIADRADFLAWKNLDSIQNGQKVLRSAQIQNFVYEQRDDLGATDLTLTVVGKAASGGNIGAGINPVRINFGGAGADEIVGGTLDDRLYGGGEADTLRGNQGNDYLEGGAGNDTYVWNTGDGFDTIRDTDGAGRIVINGNVLSGGIRIAQNDYISADKQFVLHFEGDPVAGGVLVVNGELRIEDFTDGDLGITFAASGTIHDVQPAENFAPDPDFIRFRGQFGTDGNDYYVLGDTSSFGGSAAFLALDGDDLLVESETNTWFIPEAYGGRGDDVIVTGQLAVEGSEYGGYAEGEGGRDFILGSTGSDSLYGDTPLGALRFEESGAVATDFFSFNRYFSSNSSDSFMPAFFYDGNDRTARYFDGELTGDYYGPVIGFADDGIAGAFEWLGLTSPETARGANDDYISAGAGNDYVVGGAGGDELYGGAGDDIIVGGLIGGGGTLFRNSSDLLYNPQIDGQHADISFTLETSRASEADIGLVRSLLAQAGDDYLDGGAGNDFIRDRDGGSDVLLGDAGDDILLDDDWIDNFHPAGPPVVAVTNYLDGGNGNDVISVSNRSPGGFDVVFGGDGDDKIQYFAGNGYLNGGPGNDRYEPAPFVPVGNSPPHWLLSQIVINDFSRDPGEVDELRFNAIVLDPSLDFSMSRDDANLYVGIGNNDRWITIENWFVGQEYKIERFVFDFYWTPEVDQVYDIAAIESRFQVASDNADFLWAGDGGTPGLAGGPGDDTLVGGAGDDVLAGNAGSDVLDGGQGADVYAFNAGDGADRIEDSGQAGSDGISFGPGIMKDQLAWQPDTLTLNVGSNGDAIRLGPEEAIDIANPGGIEYLQFADGTTMFFRELTDPAFIPGALNFESPVFTPSEGNPPSGGSGSGAPDGSTGGGGTGSGGNGGQSGGGGQPGGGGVNEPGTGGGGAGPVVPGGGAGGGDDGVPVFQAKPSNRSAGNIGFDEDPLPALQPVPGSGTDVGGVRQARRSVAELVDSYFDDQPRFDPDMFADQALPGSGRAEASSSQKEIARRWARIAQYLEDLNELTDEDARGGASEWHSIDFASLVSSGGASSQAFGHAGSIGATRGLGNLKTLQGLSEGFSRIPMQS